MVRRATAAMTIGPSCRSCIEPVAIITLLDIAAG
jgi:hypothetical protein